MLSVRAATFAAFAGLVLIPALARAQGTPPPAATPPAAGADSDRDGKATVLPGVADLAQVRQWLDAQSKSH